MDREQMTMRKCISSAPDQPRLILAEKRMLVGRQRDELRFPQPLGLDKPWVAQNSGVLLDSFFTGPEVGTWQQVGWWAAGSDWVSTRGVRKGRREFNPYSGVLTLVMNGCQQEQRLLSLGGCAWLRQSSHHVDISCKGRKVIFVHLVHCNSVVWPSQYYTCVVDVPSSFWC